MVQSNEIAKLKNDKAGSASVAEKPASFTDGYVLVFIYLIFRLTFLAYNFGVIFNNHLNFLLSFNLISIIDAFEQKCRETGGSWNRNYNF